MNDFINKLFVRYGKFVVAMAIGAIAVLIGLITLAGGLIAWAFADAGPNVAFIGAGIAVAGILTEVISYLLLIRRGAIDGKKVVQAISEEIESAKDENGSDKVVEVSAEAVTSDSKSDAAATNSEPKAE